MSNPALSRNFIFKIILAGSGGCGKTSLLNRFCNGTFSDDTKITIGISFAVKELDIPELDAKCNLQVWDLGGEERFRTMLPSFCFGARGCLLLFDLTRYYTFTELEEWIRIIRESTKNNIPVYLLGSKYDTVKSATELEVRMEAINEFLQKHDILEYMNISSKTGLNVKECFKKLGVNLIEIAEKEKAAKIAQKKALS